MSLTDTDKDSTNRSNPTLNQDDSLVQRLANYTTSSNPATDQTTGTYSTSTNGMFRIVASDVVHEVDYYPSSLQVNTTAGNYAQDDSRTITIPHGLGYIPSILGYYIASGGTTYYQTPYQIFDGSAATATWEQISLSVDSTNLYIAHTAMVYGASSSFSNFTIRYYLLKETAN